MEPPSAVALPVVGRRRLPPFITELWEDPAAFRTLIAACAAVAAVGLDPHIFDPGMPAMRAAVKESDDVRSLLMVGAVIQAGLLLLGGFMADRFRSERMMRAALAGLAVASVLAIVVPDGYPLVVARFLGWLSGGLVLPFAIGAIAIAYRGPARATALGAAYGVFGATTATWPALATMNGPTGSPWPAFALCAVVAVIAFAINRAMPDLPGAQPEHRPTMTSIALFSFGVVAIVASVIHVGTGFDALRLGTLLVGVVSLGLSFVPRVRSHDGLSVRGVDLRPVAVALAIGVVVGFAQAGPMLQLPQFFTIVQGSDPLIATIGMAPFVIALLVAGPVSGWLLQRFQPRVLISAGAVAIGLANLILVVILQRSTGYPFFILPYLLIGAGFVIATTVRTAIIFASVPKDLPATAAALNEASIGMGSRIGVVVVVVTTTTVAIQSFTDRLGNDVPGLVGRAVDQFRTVLDGLSLHSVAYLTAGIDPLTVQAYQDSVVDGLRFAWLLTGIVAIIAGVISFFAMGSRDPVRSVWELADERTPETGAQVVEEAAAG